LERERKRVFFVNPEIAIERERERKKRKIF